jgi:succinate dehydrogenase / fumarate reductase flavoprotein subunit
LARFYDVIIVGGGLAGCRSALALAQAHRSVALISKVHPIRSHSVAAQGGIAAALQHLDRADDWLTHAYDTVKGSDYLADQDAVALLTQLAPSVLLDLEKLGVLFSRLADGRIAQRAFGGHSYRRVCYAADKTGHAILHELFCSLGRLGVQVYDEWYVVELVYRAGEVEGVIAFHLATGELEVFIGKAVIMATGGYGRVFNTTSNDFASTGDGLALTLACGLPLQDMEFVQFHPTGLYPSGVLISEAVRGEGAYLINDLGERFMANYPLSAQAMELAPRDITSRHIASEIAAGRGIGGGPYVYLDVRHLGAELICERIPFAREEGLRLAGVDCIYHPLPVRPTVHYSMGGIPTNTEGQVLDHSLSKVEGYFACGECACVSVHGANRLGANSLLECVVFGKRVGEFVADYVATRTMPQVDDQALLEKAERRISHLLESRGSQRIAKLRSHLQNIMTDRCGIFRHAEQLTIGINDIHRLQTQYREDLHLEDRGKVFNMELQQALELGSLIKVGLAIMTSALHRQESRGAHFREDYPPRDDVNFLHHSLIWQQEEELQMGKRPVNLSLQTIDPKRFALQPRTY